MFEWKLVKQIPKRHAFVFGSVFAGVKSGAADVFIQTHVEKVDKVDWRRTSIFATFGFAFCGVWQYTLFVKTMPRLVPGAEVFINKPFLQKLKDVQGWKGVGIQVGIENFINNTFLFFPCFYSIKECIEGRPLSLSAGMRVYTRDYTFNDEFWTDLTSIWKVWIPAQIINFGFSPMWFRVPYVACVSFGWTCWVSLVRGQPRIVEGVSDSEVSCPKLVEKE